MNDKQHTDYLENILRVIRADDVLAPEEEQFIELVRVRIGAKKRSLSAAQKAASEAETTPSLASFDRFSIRIANLEDMIEATLVDGEVSPSEKSLLRDVARSTGLNDGQLQQLVREAARRHATMPSKCPSCGEATAPDAKFCGSCGQDLSKPTDRQKTSLSFSVPSDGIFIAFARSTSASFSKCLELAKKSGSFQQIDRDGKEWFAASFSKDQMLDAAALASPLGSLKNREVYVDGSLREWRDVFGFVSCAENRRVAYSPIQYCFGLDDDRLNIWGCRRIRMDWTAWDDWFTFGEFIDATRFAFDRQKIVHELRLRTAKVRHCPHFRAEFVEAVVDHLPKTAAVGKNTGWKYQECYEPNPKAIRVKVRHSDGWTETIKAIGVRPTSADLAEQIIRRAAATANYKEATHL